MTTNAPFERLFAPVATAEVQLTPHDYLMAQRLHWRWLVALIVSVGLASVVMALIFWMTGNRPPAAAMIIAGLIFLLYPVLILPYAVRRVFRQQKSLHEPHELLIGRQGVQFISSIGHTTMPWHYFHSWAENETLLLLYQSAQLMHMLPKRIFTPDELEQVRALIAANVARKR